MKKLLFSLLSMFLVVGFATAQEAPDKALKRASRAMGSYNLDPANNEGKLQEAKDMIDIATADATVGGQSKAWKIKGDVYATYLENDMKQVLVNPSYQPKHAAEGLVALEAYQKALEKAVKKYETKDAVTGLSSVAKNLNIIGNSQIQARDYAGAYHTFGAVLAINDLVKNNGGDAPIIDEEVNNQKFVVAFCADAAGEGDKACSIFKELYDSGFEDAGVYSKNFTCMKNAGDMEGALKALEAGRAKFPDNVEILFTEINYYIGEEKYDVLESKLKQAIEAEPNNSSIRGALGNVYMNLYQKEVEANGKSEKAEGYFKNSLDYYGQAIEIEPNNADAIYSIGSLYYNEAVRLAEVQKNLGMSKEDQKRYEELNAEIKEQFNVALPYFQKSEIASPSDVNTLIALKEIFAKKDDLVTSNEMKKRLATVQGGGKNESSFFK